MVDDDPSKRRALIEALEPLGLPIVEADSGQAALRRVLEENFAVILLDVRMPDMDGFETAALMRRRKESEMTPIIFFTAFQVDEVGKNTRYVSGAVDFMIAPVEPEELRAKVSAFVNLYLQAATFARQAGEVQVAADHLKLLTDSAPIGIFRTDSDNKFVYTNPRWTEISGISWQDAIGWEWETLIGSAPSPGEPFEPHIPTDVTGVGRRFEMTVSGSPSRIVLMTSEPIYGPQGELIGSVGTLADVTAETRAAQERSRFQSLVQNSRDVIAVIDSSGHCSYVSPGIFEVSGFTPEEVIGSMGFDFIHPDDVGAITSHLSEIVSTPDSMKTVEVRTQTKKDGWIWIEIRAVNRLTDPSIEGIVLNYHDITVRKAAEAERVLLLGQHKDLADQLRMLLDSTGEGIYGVDMNGVCTFMNKAGAYLLGGSADDFVGHHMHELMHHTRPDGSAYPAEECPIVLGIRAGKRTHTRSELVWRLDGSSFPADYSSFPIGGDGSGDGAVVTFQDVSARLGMEEELRQSETLFRGAFDAAQTGIAIISPDGLTYIDVNQALCEMLGYSRAELLKLDWEAITHPDDLDRAIKEVAAFVESPEDLNLMSKRYVRKDGDIVWIEISDSKVRGPDGALMYYVSHVTDVTKREEATLEQERLETQLVQAQKMEAVGQLAGGVAHDFNNILSVILNYAKFATEGLEEDDERLGDIQEIIKAGDKAATLVHQLLAFSRKEIVEVRAIDLNEVVTGIYQMLSRSLGEDIDLDFKAFDGLPAVIADPGRIEQVLLNLAVNARDAMPLGGVLKVSTGTELVMDADPLGLVPGDYVVITVSDSGSGMDEAIVDRIFEPFFTTKPLGEGTGMGLSSAYGIIEQAGGSLSVQSAVGVGTTFKIHLPCTEVSLDSTLNEAVVETMQGTETVLLVEDEDAVRELVSRILRQQGYHVVPFATGAEALEYCRANIGAIDLLLTDVVMSKMSGKELAERATAMKGNLKTLYMSGYTDELIAQRGVLASGENLIGKPFNPEELLVTVRSLLDQKVAV